MTPTQLSVNLKTPRGGPEGKRFAGTLNRTATLKE